MGRLAPIFMTASCAGLARVPLVIAGRAAGNEIQASMGVVILGGLLSPPSSTCWSCRFSTGSAVARPSARLRSPPRVRSSHGARFGASRSGMTCPSGDLPAERDKFVDKIWSRGGSPIPDPRVPASQGLRRGPSRAPAGSRCALDLTCRCCCLRAHLAGHKKAELVMAAEDRPMRRAGSAALSLLQCHAAQHRREAERHAGRRKGLRRQPEAELVQARGGWLKLALLDAVDELRPRCIPG